MAYGRLKTNMHGDTSRWGRRAEVKHEADRIRRLEDKEEVGAAVDDVDATGVICKAWRICHHPALCEAECFDADLAEPRINGPGR